MKRLCQGLLCEDLGREDVDIGSAHEVKAFDEEKKSNMESRPRKIGSPTKLLGFTHRQSTSTVILSKWHQVT